MNLSTISDKRHCTVLWKTELEGQSFPSKSWWLWKEPLLLHCI